MESLKHCIAPARLEIKLVWTLERYILSPYDADRYKKSLCRWWPHEIHSVESYNRQLIEKCNDPLLGFGYFTCEWVLKVHVLKRLIVSLILEVKENQ